MTCPCRHHAHPMPADIPAGLTLLPRAVASYGGFRRAMLSDASAATPLDAWVAREPGDLGVLMVEMWAVACGIVAFADETICHECYLRTARLDDSLRRLVALLGYKPRPAVAATVEISATVAGRDPVTLTAGTALRSGTVDEHAPQVFELLGDLVAHPLANGFDVLPGGLHEISESTPGSGVATFGSLTVLVEGLGLVAGAPVRIVTPSETPVATIERADRLRGPGPQRSVLELATEVALTAGTRWDQLTVETSSVVAGLWTLQVTGLSQPGISTSGSTTTLTLDSVHRGFVAGGPVVLERDGLFRWFTISSVEETTYRISPDVSYSTDEGSYTLPGAATAVTRLELDASIDDSAHRAANDTATWGDADSGQITVRGGWTVAGRFETPSATELADSTEPLDVGEQLDTPWSPFEPTRFTVTDRDGRAITVDGSLDWEAGDVHLGSLEADPPLRFPIRVEANVGTATRGDTVVGEILGSGDAAQVNQVFSLASSPLTYLGPSASRSGEVAASTLTIWVDGIRWSEVPHFVGPGPADRVYVVRHADDGGTEVVFGDGVRGARLPTGTDNVVADYRHGGGAIHPPAGSIAQLVQPVEGVTAVVNRSAAYGGSDAASPSELRELAPRSALLLGRIVSRADAEAVARETPGVVVATAAYGWHPERLGAGIVVRYVGDEALASGLRQRLRSLAERDVWIDAVVSPPHPIALTVTLAPDPAYHRDDVEAAVNDALTGSHGALTPQVIGIDAPLFRSRLAAAVTAVEGVSEVSSVLLDGAAFDQTGVLPPPGGHLEAVAGLTIVLQEVPHGA